MHKRGIITICTVILLLAIFFQLNRMDIFPKFFNSPNIYQEIIVADQLDEELLAKKENFLLLFDPTSVYSTYGKSQAEKYLIKIKRNIECHYFADLVDFSTYKAVIVVVDELAAIPDAILRELSQYAESGGSVYLTGGMSPHWLLKQAGGIATGSAMQEDYGICFYNNALIGTDDFVCSSETFKSYFLPCSITDDSQILATTYNKKPLLWERHYGKGKFVVFNSVNALQKDWRGVFAIGLSHLYDDFSYPVIGAKLVFIDDFLAPVPAGKLNNIYNEFKMSTEEFYRNIWWPDMLGISVAHNIKYTGLVAQSFNDRVTAPFIADAGDNAKSNLTVYGRELLKSGGELGIHGYNLQPLAPAGYNQDKLGYKAWKNLNDMLQSLKALKDYFESVYPYYFMKTYVPPANILSPEGKAAIHKVFPTVNIFSSLYNGPYEERCLYQDFGRNNDKSYDIPRISSGFNILDDGYMINFSLINAYGISSHFVNPNELYFAEYEGQRWGFYHKSFSRFVREINDRYPWLRPATASETAHYIDIYYDFDYVANYLENGDLEFLTNGVPDAYLIFRTKKEIESVRGCALRKLEQNVYLLQTEKTNRCLICFKKEQQVN